MALHNFTPHTVVFVDGNGNAVNFTSVGIARVSEEAAPVPSIADFPAVRIRYGPVTGLPAALPPGDWAIVSSMVLAALPADYPAVAPYDMVRDGDGKVIGCRAFRIQ